LCERGHPKWFSEGYKRGWCSYIIAYSMTKIGGTNALFCGDLPIHEKIPPEYFRIVGEQ